MKSSLVVLHCTDRAVPPLSSTMPSISRRWASFLSHIIVTLSDLDQADLQNVVQQCPEEVGVEACFGSHDDSVYLADDLKQTWRLWMFQVCTQWGYFMPAHTDQPTLLSKRYVISTTRYCSDRASFR